MPRGNHLLGTVLFGLFGFALAYFFLYQALEDAGAGTTMTVLAIVPLLTVLLSIVHGIERPRPLGVVGALIAAAGIVIVAADQLSLDVPMLAIGLLLVAAVCQAESVVIVKRLPPGDPVAANAIGMLLGGALLVAVSLVTGETLALPTQPDTWLAMAYLVVLGSIVVFVLALYVLAHWTASATSYGFLLFPLVAIATGTILLGEPVQPSFLFGGRSCWSACTSARSIAPRSRQRTRPTERQPSPRRGRRAQRRRGLARLRRVGFSSHGRW